MLELLWCWSWRGGIVGAALKSEKLFWVYSIPFFAGGLAVLLELARCGRSGVGAVLGLEVIFRGHRPSVFHIGAAVVLELACCWSWKGVEVRKTFWECRISVLAVGLVVLLGVGKV